MAPHSSYRKHVKFAKSRSPVPRKKPSINADSYANIVLHYLAKLKSLFHSPTNKTSSCYNRASYDNISKPILKGSRKSGYSDSDLDSRQKAYDIVNAALQYGCANNIIEKVGNYFLVKNQCENRVVTRRPTPGPDYIRCANCKNLTKYSRKRRNGTSLDKVLFKSKRGKMYYADKYGRTSSFKKKRRSDTPLVNYCTKCYARIKSNKKL